jgi:hypothetical protein
VNKLLKESKVYFSWSRRDGGGSMRWPLLLFQSGGYKEMSSILAPPTAGGGGVAGSTYGFNLKKILSMK